MDENPLSFHMVETRSQYMVRAHEEEEHNNKINQPNPLPRLHVSCSCSHTPHHSPHHDPSYV